MDNSKPTLEWVCSGNCSRSETARLESLKVLDERGLLERYNVISSGTVVNDIRDARKRKILLNKEVQRFVIGEGIKQNYFGLSTPFVKRLFKKYESKTLEEAEIPTFRKYGLQALEIFIKQEHEARAKALAELGLGPVKQIKDQTVVRDDTVLLLGMAQDHQDFFDTLEYNGRKRPKTGLVKAYATGEQNAQLGENLGDSSCLDYEGYLGLLKEVQKYARMATEMFLDQTG